jgi:EmrB/QacA subfamily drug resistance transporter
MAQPFVEPCCTGVIEATTAAAGAGPGLSARSRSFVLAGCVLASSMVFVDGSALTVALPRLREALGADLTSVQWVLNAYVLALASLTLIGGALADTHGKARMLLIGCVLFGAASIACALAPSAAWLIAARALQGTAAALLTPASLALIGVIYPKNERSRAIAIWAAASSLTTAGGPVLGGWLTETFGWQAVFWINPPIAALALAVLWIYGAADRREPRRFDFVGAALIAVSLGALAWTLSRIGNSDSPVATTQTETVLAGALGLAGLAAFFLWERVTASPMVPPRLARHRVFVALNGATLLVYAGLAIMFFLIPFDLVERRGLSPLDAGLTFMPFTLGVGLLSRLFSGLADRLGTRTMLIAGPLGAAVAFGWMAMTRDTSLAVGVLGPMFLLGVSFAVLIAPLTASVLSSVETNDEGLASGINNTISRIAQLAGVAIGAGIGTLAAGYQIGLTAAAALSAAGALVIALMMPATERT